MDAHSLYKPFRNYLRQFPVLESLAVIHARLQAMQFGQPLPRGIEGTRFPLAPSNSAHEWEIELLCKEMLLNGQARGHRSLRVWKDYAEAINYIKELDGAIFDATPGANALHEMFRIAHKQFPWQRKPNLGSLVRHFKIFASPSLDKILQRKIGLDAHRIFLIGMTLLGHYAKSFRYDYPAPVQLPPVTQEDFEKFLAYFSRDLDSIRTLVAREQRYDEDYMYAFNPVKQFPLIRTVINTQTTALAPIPTLLFRKFTSGIYYDVVTEVGFSDAYGPAFERYVGEALSVAKAPSWQLLGERLYNRGDRTIDWILSSDDADIFVECKTKRLRAESKVLSSSLTALKRDLEKLADAVVQAYVTIGDAVTGKYPHWSPRSLPCYLAVVSIEEWFLLNPEIHEQLDEFIVAKFRARGLDLNLREAIPVMICSIEDFEAAVQVMSSVGIHNFMSRKCIGPQKIWDLFAFLATEFPDELKNVKRNLFPDALASISPALK